MTTNTVTAHTSPQGNRLWSTWKAPALLVFAACAVLTITVLSFLTRPAPSIQLERVGTRGDVQIYFGADRATVLAPNDCLHVYWEVQGAQQTYLNGVEVGNDGEQEVCLNTEAAPTLGILLSDDTREYILNVVVLLQERVVWIAAALAAFLILSAILLTPPIAHRIQGIYTTSAQRIQRTNDSVPISALLTRTQNVLRFLLLATGVVYLILYVGIVLARINYPFELEWMEGASVDTVSRVLNNQPLYAAPSTEYVSPIYGPVYFYISALFARVLGLGFFSLRLVSFLASLGCFALIYQFVKRETSDRFSAFMAAALFAATFNITGSWFDLARVDSLFLFFLLLGVYLVKFSLSPLGFFTAGVIFSASILTKQSALVVVALIALYCILSHTRLSMYLIGALVVVIGGTTLLLDYISQGWYSYFVFGMAQQQATIGSMRFEFWQIDLAVLPVAVVLLIVVIQRQFAAQHFVQTRFYTLFGVGMIASSWIMRLHHGGWLNGLIPAYTVLAMFFGLGIAALISLTADLSVEKRSPILVALYIACLLQFGGLLYDPNSHIPTEEDLQAGNAFIERLENTDGDVLLFGHGYYAAMAGKSGYQLGWLMNIVSGNDGHMKTAFIDMVNDAIAQQRFSVIIGDNATFLHEDFEATLNAFYAVEVIPYEGAAFLPVTGAGTRPTFLFTPRSE